MTHELKGQSLIYDFFNQIFLGGNMFKFIIKGSILTLVILCLVIIAGPASAQETDDIDPGALIQQFLPDGVSIENATDDQLLAAVSQACEANPQVAAQIVTRAIQSRPDLAPAIASAAATAAPDQAVAITIAAVQAAPDQSQAIADAVSQAVPAQAAAVRQAAQQTARTQQAQQAVQQAQQQSQQAGTPPPSRDDGPASPVN
jgi:hypothetical protein